MTHYWVGYDMDLGEHEDLNEELNDGNDILFVKNQQVDADVDVLDGDRFEAPDMISATPEEAGAWNTAYNALSARVCRADAALDRARHAWERAKEEAAAERKAAWQDYASVQKGIELRQDLLLDLRVLRIEEEARAAREATDAALRAEDEQLGPREFLVTRPRLRNQQGTHMDVPTIHLVGCPSTKRMKSLPQPVRMADAFEALLEGGKRYVMTWRWEEGVGDERFFGEVCNRCAAEAKILDAYPVAYTEWRDKAESIQPPLPRTTYAAYTRFFARLGVPVTRAGTSGFFRMESGTEEKMRRDGVITQHEGLLGWSDGKYRKADPEQLETLRTALKKEHMTARYANEEKDLVAFRLMTKAEIRRVEEEDS